MGVKPEGHHDVKPAASRRPGLPIITMVGSSVTAKGGIAAVVKALVSGGLSERYVIDYVESHVDGSSADKLAAAARAWLGLLCRLVAGNVSLMHVHISSRASFWRKSVLLLPALMLRRKILLHLHGGEFKIFYERECSRLGRSIIRRVFESAVGVVVLSKGWGKWVRASFPAAKVRVIYNPAPSVVPTPDDRRDDRSLLFLGRLGSQKGTDNLLQAVARIPKEVGEVKVLLGGDGDVLAMKQLARELGIEKSVEFLGWVDGPRKSQLLRQCSVFVLPSYNEGLPMGLLEAMAHGMPVLTTPVGGIPEAVTDGVEGFLIEPGDVDALADRLVRLLRAPALRATMGVAGVRKVAEVFAMEQILPQWVALYSENGVMPASGR